MDFFDKLYNNWLKIIDEYVAPFCREQLIDFLRSKDGMYIILLVVFFFILY